MSPAPLIWINAYPGTGKQTIAHLLIQNHIGKQNAVLVHNHAMVDPIVRAGFPPGTPGRETLRRILCAGLLEVLVKSPGRLGQVFVFTAWVSTLISAAFASGRPFIPVYLSISHEENMRRGTCEERRNGGTTKPATVERLAKVRELGEPYQVLDDDLKGVRLDVTDLSAEEAARMVWGAIKKISS